MLFLFIVSTISLTLSIITSLCEVILSTKVSYLVNSPSCSILCLAVLGIHTILNILDSSIFNNSDKPLTCP